MVKIKWFWIWQDKKEESWLHEMALKGFHLDAINFPCVYRFKQGQPSSIFYCMDFLNQASQGFEQYLQPRIESGWRLISKMNGWQYFCISAQGDDHPELPGNKAAKAEKFQRLMTFMVGFLPIMLLWFPVIDNRLTSPFYEILGVIFVLSLAVFTFSTFKIYQRISQLREL